MAIGLRTRKSIIVPRLDGIKDPAINQVLNDLEKVFKEFATNVYDDLTAISTTAYVNAVYFGDPNTDGSWRILQVGNDLSIQRRESSAWVQKDLITA